MKKYLNKGFNMIKKWLFISFVCSFVMGNTINSIVAIVENEPVTSFELEKVKNEFKLSDKNALDLLIRDRLEQAQIKDLNIVVSPFEINQKIDEIAKKNNMTSAKLRDELEYKQGIKFSDFKNDVKKGLLQEKLYSHIFSNNSRKLDEETAINFFQANKEKFSTFKTIKVTIFRADNPQILEMQKQNALKPLAGVKMQDYVFNYESINPRLALLLSSTETGSFTKILHGQESHDMFYIREKNDLFIPDFEDVKDQVMGMLINSEREKIASEYFDKLRSKAKIQIVRGSIPN